MTMTEAKPKPAAPIGGNTRSALGDALYAMFYGPCDHTVVIGSPNGGAKCIACRRRIVTPG